MDSSDEEKKRRSRLQKKKPESFDALVVEPRESTPPPYSRPETPPKRLSKRSNSRSHPPQPVESPTKANDSPWSDEDVWASTPYRRRGKPSTPKGRPKIVSPKQSPKSPPKKKVKGSRQPKSPKRPSKDKDVQSSENDASATSPLHSTTPQSAKRKRGLTIKRRHLIISPLSIPQQATTSEISSAPCVDIVTEQVSNQEVDFSEKNVSSGDDDFMQTPPTAISNEPDVLPTEPTSVLPSPTAIPVEPTALYVPKNVPQPSTSRTCRRRQSNENEENKNVEVNINAINQARLSTTETHQTTTSEHPKETTGKKKFPVMRERPQNETSTPRLPQRPCVDTSDDESSDNEEKQRRRLRQQRRRRKYPGQIRLGSSSSSDKASSKEDSNDDEWSPILPPRLSGRRNGVLSSEEEVDPADNSNEESDDFEEELSETDQPSRIVVPSTKGFVVDMSNIPHHYNVLLRLGERTERHSEDPAEELEIIRNLFIDNKVDVDPAMVWWKKLRAYMGRPEKAQYVLKEKTKKQPNRHRTMESYVRKKLKENQSGAGAARFASKTQEQLKEINSKRRQRYRTSSKYRENAELRRQENLKYICYQLILTKQPDLMGLGTEEILQRVRDDPLLDVTSYTGEWASALLTASYRQTHSTQKKPISPCRELVNSGYRCLQNHIQIFQSKAESAIFETYVMFAEKSYAETNASYSILNKVLGVRIHTSLVLKAIELGRNRIKLCKNTPTEDIPAEENKNPFDLGFQINADHFQDITDRIRGRPLQPVHPPPKTKAVQFLVYIAFGFKQCDITYSTTAELKAKLNDNRETRFHVYVGTWSRLQNQKNNGINVYHFNNPNSALYNFVKEGGKLYAGTQFVCGSLEEALELEARLIMKTYAFEDSNSFCKCLNTKYGEVILPSQDYLDAIQEGSTSEKLFDISETSNHNPTSLPLSTNLVEITNHFNIN